MHICHVITRLIIGGAQENTVLTCRGLHEHGHRVTLIAGPETGPEGSLWTQAEAIGCEVIKLDSMRRSINPLHDARTMADLKKLFMRSRPDIVHTHSSKAGILGRFAAKSARVHRIVHTIHGMSFNRTQGALTRFAYRTLEKKAARCTDMFVTVADAMIEQSVAAGLAPRERFVTIRSGMETERFAPNPEKRAAARQQWGRSDEHVVIGTVARLFENKGYDELIKAMPRVVERVPQARFVWIGDGRHRERYVQRIESLGIRDRVHLAGLVPPEELPDQLNGFDLVVHASRWEGLPRVLVQALLCEIPVVSFDNDGAPEVVQNHQTGLLVPYGDTHRLGDAIIKLATDEADRKRLGREGRRRCLETFDWKKMVHELEALYERLATKSILTGGVCR